MAAWRPYDGGPDAVAMAAPVATAAAVVAAAGAAAGIGRAQYGDWAPGCLRYTDPKNL